MNYFQFHIGDYYRRTKYLTDTEDLIYRRLLDQYYLTERPLLLDIKRLSRFIGMADQQHYVKSILEDFFTETTDGFVNKTADAEIIKYRHRAENARDNGRKGGRPLLKNNPVGSQRVPSGVPKPNPTLTQCKPDAKLTNNHKPITSIKKTSSIDTRFDEFWEGYDKKVDRKKTMAKWARLNKGEIDKIFTVLTDYVKSKPDRQYRKNPLSWLNGEGWNDEIEFKTCSVVATHQPKTMEQLQKVKDNEYKTRGFKSNKEMQDHDHKVAMNNLRQMSSKGKDK